MGYSFRLAARVLLYAPSHRQDNTYHGVCYTSHGALAGMRNNSMGPLHEGSIRRPIAPWANALTTELHLAPRIGQSNTNDWCIIKSIPFVLFPAGRLAGTAHTGCHVDQCPKTNQDHARTHAAEAARVQVREIVLISPHTAGHRQIPAVTANTYRSL